MYGRFGDPELFCGGADSGSGFDDVLRKPYGPIFDFVLHVITPANFMVYLMRETKVI